MADNPFAKYAPQPAAEANPFAKYATPASSSSEIPTTRRSYSLAQVPIEAGKNLPASASQFASGAMQAIMNPLETLQGITDIAAGGVYNLMPKAVQSAIDSMEQDVESQQRAIQAANAAGGYVKDRFGSWDAIKRTLAEDPVGAVGDLSTLLTGGAGLARNMPAMTAGALKVAGATGPATTVAKAIAPVSKAIAPVAALGQTINPMRPIAPLVEMPVKLIAKGTGAVYNAIAPKATAYLTAVEGRGPEIVNALRGANEIVPGSMPTAAQAASSVGATKFSALGAESADKLSTPFFARGEAQKAAQLAVPRAIGGTPETLAAAEKIRSVTAKDLYGIADEALVKVDSTFTNLLDRPSMNKVLARAKDLANEKAQPFQIGVTKAEQTTPSMILNAKGKPIGTTVTPATVAEYPGSSLHSMKMAFDDLINNPERFGIGAAEVNAIKGTRKQFLTWAENKAPDYRVARETFAEQSKPINKMQVGQYLEGKLTPALGEETAALRASGFAGAMENAPATLKKSTGQSRFQKLTEILAPEDIAKLEAVRADLARAKLTEQQAKAASKSGVDLGKVAAESLSGLRAPSLISTITSVANDIIRRLQGKLDNKLAIEIATEMLDPAAAAKAIELALAREARGANMAAPAVAIAKAASKVIRTPAVINALAPANEKRNALIED